MDGLGPLVAFALWIWAMGVLIWRLKKRRGRTIWPGPGASGTIYEMLNEDKRKAVELIVEEKTGERDPERATGRPGDNEATHPPSR